MGVKKSCVVVGIKMWYNMVIQEAKRRGRSMKNVEDETIGAGIDFQRIRRITGYLVGTTDRWNDAKRAEERDRVKHMTVKEQK